MGCSHAKLCCCRCPSSNSRRPSAAAASAAAASAAAASDSVRPSSRLFLTGSTIGTATIPSAGLLLRYSTLSQRGHYPGSPYRENQDCFLVRTHLQSRPDAHLFAVFDGHGQFGAQCAAFTRDRLVDVLTADPALFDDPPKAYASAFAAVNSDLHASGIDDTMSGTTGIAVLVAGDTMWVANVGDSRAVAGVLKDGAVLAEELSRDQTPFRKDEYERVRRCGARVLSVDQVEGIKDPEVQSWGDEESDEGDPPRLWVQNGMYPGTAFTRSIGDSTAEGIGVIAEPEVLRVKISPDHLFFVVASDGVFEFLSSQAVVEMVAKFMDPRGACSAIAAASYKKWLEHESRTDDITLIVVHIKDLCDSGAEVTDTSSLTGSESLVVSDKENDGVPAPQRSATCHQGATNLFKMQYHPVDISMEWNSARVASSPKCSAVRNG